MIANPTEWPEAQRVFHLAYLDDPTRFARRSVVVSWTTSRSWGGVLGLIASVWKMASGHHEGLEVVVSGSNSAMRFSADSIPGSRDRQGRTTGVLVGELGTNAVGCVEVDGGVIWPTANPVERQRPADQAARPVA